MNDNDKEGLKALSITISIILFLVAIVGMVNRPLIMIKGEYVLALLIAIVCGYLGFKG